MPSYDLAMERVDAEAVVSHMGGAGRAKPVAPEPEPEDSEEEEDEVQVEAPAPDFD